MSNYTHRIIGRETPYQDACKHLGISPVGIEQFAFLPENQRQYMLAQHRVVTVLDVIKEGDAPFNWNDYGQYKYSPWWDMETYGDASVGSGFSFLDYDYGNAYTAVGSRLCTLSKEQTKYVAEIMKADYRVLMKG